MGGGDGEEGGEVKVGGAQAGRQAGGCMSGGEWSAPSGLAYLA